MGKTLLVLKREFLSRVTTKQFWIITFLGPILMSLVVFVPVLLHKYSDSKYTVMVLDEHQLLTNFPKSDENLQFVRVEDMLDSAIAKSKATKQSGLLYIPKELEYNSIKGIVLYTDNQPSLSVNRTIEKEIVNAIEARKMGQLGISQASLDSIKLDGFTLKSVSSSGSEKSDLTTGIATAFGSITTIIMYMFIILYGVQVMRGVTEEKSNRIVEVIISSVRPFQLMLGKIFGIGLVGLFQFLLWIVLTGVFLGIAVTFTGGMGNSATSGTEMMSQGKDLESLISNFSNNNTAEIMAFLGDLPFLITMFLFYFIMGYFQYAALFAAVGSAVDQEQDAQQLMFPITIPIIISFIVAQIVVTDPNGSLGFWFSIIPFSSPIVMMSRLPFNGVETWELILSMGMLVGGVLFMTWIAGRIYRVGILLYGKKVSLKELGKWIFYKI